MIRKSSLALLVTSPTSALALAQSDREIAVNIVTPVANVYPRHSSERAAMTVRKVPVGSLRVIWQGRGASARRRVR